MSNYQDYENTVMLLCNAARHAESMLENGFDPNEYEDTDVLEKLEEEHPGSLPEKRLIAQNLAGTAQVSANVWRLHLDKIRWLMECDLSVVESFVLRVIESKQLEAADMLRYIEAYDLTVARSREHVPSEDTNASSDDVFGDMDAAINAAFVDMREASNDVE